MAQQRECVGAQPEIESSRDISGRYMHLSRASPCILGVGAYRRTQREAGALSVRQTDTF